MDNKALFILAILTKWPYKTARSRIAVAMMQIDFSRKTRFVEVVRVISLIIIKKYFFENFEGNASLSEAYGLWLIFSYGKSFNRFGDSKAKMFDGGNRRIF